MPVEFLVGRSDTPVYLCEPLSRILVVAFSLFKTLNSSRRIGTRFDRIGVRVSSVGLNRRAELLPIRLDLVAGFL